MFGTIGVSAAECVSYRQCGATHQHVTLPRAARSRPPEDVAETTFTADNQRNGLPKRVVICWPPLAHVDLRPANCAERPDAAGSNHPVTSLMHFHLLKRNECGVYNFYFQSVLFTAFGLGWQPVGRAKKIPKSINQSATDIFTVLHLSACRTFFEEKITAAPFVFS